MYFIEVLTEVYDRFKPSVMQHYYIVLCNILRHTPLCDIILEILMISELVQSKHNENHCRMIILMFICFEKQNAKIKNVNNCINNV